MAIDSRNKRASTVHLPWTTWPLADATVAAADRAQFTGYYSGLTYSVAVAVVTVTKTRFQYEIELYNRNGDLKKILTKSANVDWEYNRIGGCGQAQLDAPYEVFGTFDQSLTPGDEMRIKIRNELRYSGKLVRISRSVRPSDERLGLLFNGYVTELQDKLVQEDYTSTEVSAIVQDILDTHVVGSTKITYSVSDIEETDYVVESISFNHSVMDALVLLANLAGNVEWGVNRSKEFFFKQRDANVRRAYILGKDITDYTEVEDHESVKNLLNVYGSSGEILATIQDTISQSLYGVRKDNLFESSINEQADASRLGIVTMKNISISQRQIKFRLMYPDLFLESSVPLGATAATTKIIPVSQKYGTYFKYGRSQRYGNLKRDQIKGIKYRISEGGLDSELTLGDDIPNLGSQQKRVQYEIKELQRR